MRNSPNRTRSLLLVALVYVAAFGVAGLSGRMASGHHPLAVALWADVVATVVVFAGSLALRNSSAYDPYWSVAPPLLGLYWLTAGRIEEPNVWRAGLLMTLLLCWAIRLTWNWTLRWKGLVDEDWRYVGFQRLPFYGLVNFTAIHLFPTLLVYLACLPVFVGVALGSRPLGWLDLVAAVVAGSAIWIEARADRDLRRHRKGPLSETSLSTGVWARSRHPNYLGEIAFWWGLYFFGLAAQPSWWWTVAGPVAITLLFLLYSIPAMEKHLAESRPDYQHYADRTPILIPWPRGPK